MRRSTKYVGGEQLLSVAVEQFQKCSTFRPVSSWTNYCCYRAALRLLLVAVLLLRWEIISGKVEDAGTYCLPTNVVSCVIAAVL